LSGVTVMIFTLNEEIHLPSCLESLAWCDDVIVVDSYSTDRTREISSLANARFFQNRFEGFGSQRNWALDHAAPKHDWILILDADERPTPELAAELRRIAAEDPAGVGAYRVKRRFHLWGKWLRHSSLYPTWVVRFIRKDRVRYVDRGHAETQTVDGRLLELENDLLDENKKGLGEWFERQNRYSTKEAEYEIEQEKTPLRLRDIFSGDPLRRRHALKRISWRVPFRPFAYFLYAYVWRRGFLDGAAGWRYCVMKSMFHSMVVLKKAELRGGR
jgi:glycosyltransferase involved in cell wall biosynthesis